MSEKQLSGLDEAHWHVFDAVRFLLRGVPLHSRFFHRFAAFPPFGTLTFGALSMCCDCVTTEWMPGWMYMRMGK